MSNTATMLHDQGVLPDAWRVIAAPRTYNPLGSLSTFLSSTDIVECVKEILPMITLSVNGRTSHDSGSDGLEDVGQSYIRK
jgi:hypothetical protein